MSSPCPGRFCYKSEERTRKMNGEDQDNNETINNNNKTKENEQ